MDVNPQGSHIHFRDPQTPWINDPNSVSMEEFAFNLNFAQCWCDLYLQLNDVDLHHFFAKVINSEKIAWEVKWSVQTGKGL